IEFAIVTHAHVTRAEALVPNQVRATHNLEETMREVIGIGANREVPVYGRINPEWGEPLHGLAGADRLAAHFHRFVGFAGDKSRECAEHGDVDVLADAGSLGLMKRSKDADDAKQSSREIGDGQPHAYWRI